MKRCSRRRERSRARRLTAAARPRRRRRRTEPSVGSEHRVEALISGDTPHDPGTRLRTCPNRQLQGDRRDTPRAPFRRARAQSAGRIAVAAKAASCGLRGHQEGARNGACTRRSPQGGTAGHVSDRLTPKLLSAAFPLALAPQAPFVRPHDGSIALQNLRRRTAARKRCRRFRRSRKFLEQHPVCFRSGTRAARREFQEP